HDTEARRHHVPADGHGVAGRAGAAHHADQRRVAVLRDLHHRRPRAAAERRRPGERRLEHRQDAAALRAQHDRRRLQGARRPLAAAQDGAPVSADGERPPARSGPARPPDPGGAGSGLSRRHAVALPRPAEGASATRSGGLHLQALRHGAESAPARADDVHRGSPGAGLGRHGVQRRGAAAHARLAALAWQHHRGRDVGDPAQHHRQERARAAGLTMALALIEEQEILQRTAREFVQGKSSFKRIRPLRDEADGEGFSRELWAEMGRLGWLGIVVPEAYGGAGLGWVDLMVVLEELGRGLIPEPIVGTLLLGTTALLLGGSEAQKQAHLPAVVAGERLLAVAYQEPASRYALHHVETRAERAGNGWTLSGRKVHVPDGQAADWSVVPARTAGGADDERGVTLFLVRHDAPGLHLERQRRVDSRGAAIMRLEGVRAEADAILGVADQGAALLSRVVDRATIGLCAEMLGSMSACFDMTLEYLKTRTQFGVPIGSFQALKHRAARQFIEV